MFSIDQRSYDLLVAHARAEYPNEACALLAGRDETVEKVYTLPNAEASPTFYVVEPNALFQATKELEGLGLDVIGVFHSHTFTEAYPSRTDVQLAFIPSGEPVYPKASYLILSLADQDAPVLRAFRIRAAGDVSEEPIRLVGSPDPVAG